MRRDVIIRPSNPGRWGILNYQDTGNCDVSNDQASTLPAENEIRTKMEYIENINVEQFDFQDTKISTFSNHSNGCEIPDCGEINNSEVYHSRPMIASTENLKVEKMECFEDSQFIRLFLQSMENSIFKRKHNENNDQFLMSSNKKIKIELERCKITKYR